MARSIEFDKSTVRQVLLEAFWVGGYAATPIGALEAATGVGRRSLYNTFGDKDAMFRLALKDFRAMAGAQFLAPMEAVDASPDTIDAMLDALVVTAETSEGRKGCFVCNTAREPVAGDPKIGAEIDAYFERMRGAFHHALSGNGDALDIEVTADQLIGVVVALCVLARAGADAVRLRNIRNGADRLIAPFRNAPASGDYVRRPSMGREIVFPPGKQAVFEQYGYSAAVKSGDLLFVSGQVGTRPDGTADEDPEEQIRQAFCNVDAILAAAGCTRDDIVDITTFHVEQQMHFETFRSVKREFFPEPPFPNWTAIGVSFLADESFLFEMKVIARIPAAS